MEMRKLIFAAALFLCCLSARGQFYSYGDDSGGARWSQISTSSYRFVYPKGLDSLARQYALTFQKYYDAVGRSIGYAPNQAYRSKMPVILHPFTSTANGMSVWTPRRIELHTVQDAYSPSALPWIDELAIHEARHSSQMQYANSGPYRIFNVLIGQLWPGAMAAVYGNQPLFEGDAVVAETALSKSGRGRTGDFLQYYYYAMDNGDWRDWYKWQYGSLKRYTPTYYALGYMTVAGIRTKYDDPLFVERFYSNIFRHKLWPFPFFNFQHTIKEASGMKLKDTFRDIQEYFYDDWSRQAILREPFMKGEQITPDARRYRQYKGMAAASDRLFAIRSGIDKNYQLVDVETDKPLRYFSSSTSALRWSEPLGKLFWSERVPDIRWSLKESSLIMTYDPETGKSGRLTNSGRYFNPAPAADRDLIAVTSYPIEGGSQVVVLDGKSGAVEQVFQAPDGLQVLESAWIGDDIVASALSGDGTGLYYASRGFTTLLEPLPVRITRLNSSGDEVLFTSDCNSVDELYCLDTRTLELTRLSSTRYGADEFVLKDKFLYYTTLNSSGRAVFRTELEELPRISVDKGEYFHYAIADELSRQEQALGPAVTSPDPQVSAPVHYSKAAHLIKVHAWAPAYIDYNSINTISADILTYAAKPGAMAFFQNDLGTASGYAAYSYSKDSHGTGRHSGHLNFKYSGLYPVFEGTLHVNSGFRSIYQLVKTTAPRQITIKLQQQSTSEPLLTGNLKVYVPLKFNRGGWNIGIIPQVRYSYSNNIYDTGANSFLVPPGSDAKTMGYPVFKEKEEGGMFYYHRLDASLRGYYILNQYHSAVYPRLGIGAEVGASTRIGLSEVYSPNMYAYLYGYLPGLVPEQGLRLSVLAQKHIESGYLFNENMVSCLPRGFTSGSYSGMSKNFAKYKTQMTFSADYGIAFAPVDWSFLGPVAYIRNFLLTPNFDISLYSNPDDSVVLCSAGAELCAVLGNFLWLPYQTKIGVSYSYNFGPSYSRFLTDDPALRHNVQMVFNIDIL